MTNVRKCALSLLLMSAMMLWVAGLHLSCVSGRKSVLISEFSPAGESQKSTNITVVFSTNIVPSDSVEVLMDQAPVRIQPPVPGRFKWVDTRTLRFLPTELLNPATQYHVEVLPSIVQGSDQYLKGRRNFEFSTSSVRVERLSHQILSSETRPAAGRFSLTFDFSEVVDPSVFEGKLDLVWISGDARQSVGYSTITVTPAKQIAIESNELPNLDKRGTLQIILKPGWTCVNGNLPVAKEFEQSITIGGKPRLVVENIAAGREAGERFWVRIRFSSPIDMSSVRDFVEFDPSLEFQSSSEEAGSSLRLTGSIQPNLEIHVKVLEGLRAADGTRLENTFSQRVVLEDLQPSVTFASPGIYLSSQGLKNVEINVVNVDKIHIEVEKIYPNNLLYYLGLNEWEGTRNLGYRIHEEDIDVNPVKNQTTSVTVNFQQFLHQHPTGLFRLIIRRDEYYWMNDVKTVLLTDVGLIAKRTDQELSAWAISTSTLEPLSGVEVILYSGNNQEMARGSTDAGGAVKFPLTASDEFQPYLITGTSGENVSYLLFDQCRISTSDFDVTGRPTLMTGYEAFLYTDRGVYRPGDTVHAAGVVRGVGAEVPKSFPLRLEILGPDGRVFLDQTLREQDEGMVEVSIEIPNYAKTGGYVANLYGAGKQPIGRTRFSVEEFMPDRIKVIVTTDKAGYRTGDSLRIDVTGTMLFGPPAAGRKSSISYQIESVPFVPPKWNSYVFGNSRRERISSKSEEIERTLDSGGRTSVSFPIAKNLMPPAAMRITVRGEVREEGGRAVTGYATADLHAYPMYIGLRRVTEGYSDPEQEEAFRFITVDTEGNAIPFPSLTAKLFRVQWQSVLKRDRRGVMRYQSEQWDEFIDAKDLVSTGEPGTFAFTPPEWGSYRVVVSDPASGSSTAVLFYVSGWGYAPWSMENPDRIDIELDKELYRPGDIAQAVIKAPFSGKLLLTVEREKMHYSRMLTLEGNTVTVPIQVKPEYLPNAYVTAILIRAPESAEKFAPSRAYGTAPLKVVTDGSKLTVQVEMPEESRPLKPLEISVHVDDNSGRSTSSAQVTVALVDEGILQLTGFDSPDPMDFFYGKKKLEVDTYDIFAWLLPEVATSEVHSSPSGDRAEAARLGHLIPVTVRRVKPVALWSGIVRTNASGDATITFDLPQFDGKLRAMVVAASKDKFGSTEANVTVRNPIVLTPTIPRFVSSNDDFLIPVTVFNGTGSQADIRLTLEQTTNLDLEILQPSLTIAVPDGGEESVSFRVRTGRGMGKITFVLTAESKGTKVLHTVDLPFRPPAPPISETGSGSVTEGYDAVLTMPANWVEGTAKYSLKLSSLPMMKFANSLQYLLRYPYGCAEQTTSSAFPLLYFKDLAQAVEPALFEGNAPEYYVSEAIRRLVSMALPEGAFGFWPGGHTWHVWASIYALHFLAEADHAGYPVPDQILRDGRKFLRRVVRDRERRSDYYRGWGFFEPFQGRYDAEMERRWIIQQLRSQAYAAYVLALMGDPDQGSMHYFFDSMQEYLQDDSRTFLAGAFALTGDLITAYRLLPVSYKPQSDERESGGNFNSGTRMEGIILSILADVAPDNPAVPDLITSLSEKASRNQLYNTQETAWTLMALGKLLHATGKADYTGVLTIDGIARADFTTAEFALTDSALGGRQIRIAIRGEGTCYYYWEARGIPIDQQFREESNGLTVRRTYLDANGQPINLEQFRHGELYVTRIEIEAPNQRVENVIIDDMLPAGLEIENPRLSSRTRGAAVSWLPKEFDQSDYMDIRDDRMLLFTNLELKTKKRFYYSVRAVTEGTFTLPPVSAECMYDPALKSVSSSGFIAIKP